MPQVPLTRRELRELERLAGRPADEAAPSAPPAPLSVEEPADEPVATEVAAATEVAGTAPSAITEPDVELTSAADFLIAADLRAPDLEPAFLIESDRVVATPPVTDSPITPFEQLLSDVPTTTTEITLPSRAQLRAAEQAAAAGRPRRPIVAPRRLAAPPARPAAVGAPAPTSDRMRSLAAKSVTVVAMAFVALMAISTSVPAEALLSSADVQAAAFQASRPAQSGPAQSLDLAGGTDTISVERDGYQSKTIAEVAAASGIRMEATFTNDPNGTIQWPFAVGVHIGSRFGIRHCAGCSVNHMGQDFNPGIGAPIQSIADGVVSQAIDGEGSLGVHMVIDHMINGRLVSSVYAHMIHGSMRFKVGDVVKVGQVIGKTGNTGMSTGPHLHFEIRLGGLNGLHVDPLAWLYANTN